MKFILCPPLLLIALSARADGLSYAQAYDESLRSGRPLCVWVRQRQPELEKQLPRFVHCSVDSFPGVTGQGVVVAAPSRRVLYRLEDLPGTPSVERLRLAAPLSRAGLGACRIGGA